MHTQAIAATFKVRVSKVACSVPPWRRDCVASTWSTCVPPKDALTLPVGELFSTQHLPYSNLPRLHVLLRSKAPLGLGLYVISFFMQIPGIYQVSLQSALCVGSR